MTYKNPNLQTGGAYGMKCTEKYPYPGYDGREPEHEWLPWEQRDESGYIIYTQGSRTGHLEPFAREWWERKCKGCGLVQKHPSVTDNPALGILR